MKRLIVATVLVTAILSSLVQAQASDQVEETIRRLNAQEVAALLGNDAKALEGLWSKDFVVTNPFNQFLSQQEVIGLVQTGMLAFASYDRKIDYVHIYGDTAVVAGRETVAWAGKMPNAGKTSQLRFTGVWLKQDGRWLQVARHANILAP